MLPTDSAASRTRFFAMAMGCPCFIVAVICFIFVILNNGLLHPRGFVVDTERRGLRRRVLLCDPLCPAARRRRRGARRGGAPRLTQFIIFFGLVRSSAAPSDVHPRPFAVSTNFRRMVEAIRCGYLTTTRGTASRAPARASGCKTLGIPSKQTCPRLCCAVHGPSSCPQGRGQYTAAPSIARARIFASGTAGAA